MVTDLPLRLLRLLGINGTLAQMRGARAELGRDSSGLWIFNIQLYLHVQRPDICFLVFGQAQWVGG